MRLNKILEIPNKYKNLPDIYEGKVIPRNFGHIQHFTGSKMIDAEDKLMDVSAQIYFTYCKRCTADDVIVTEKIDGMNAGVVKKNGLLYPINRKGYDVRTMGIICDDAILLADTWATWVDERYDILNDILNEGERLVFENAIMQHTLLYKFKCDPVFLLAKYNENNEKVNYDTVTDIAKKYNLNQPPLLARGIAVDPEVIIRQYPNGLVGSKDGIEGVVYVYEHNGKFESSGKFVSNPKMGTESVIPNRFNLIA